MVDSSVTPLTEGTWLVCRRVLPMEGDRTSYPFLQTRFDESGAKFSPDGRWVAYSSNEAGRYEVYVREFVPSKDSAAAEDGKELVYVDLGGRVMSMSADSTRSFQAAAARAFQAPAGRNTLAASNDLKCFLIPVPVERKASEGFTV